MKTLAFPRVIFLVMSLWGAALGRSDILTVSGQGNTIMPRTSTDVSMDAETVTIESKTNEFLVNAEFFMTNRSALPVKERVGFPVVDARYGWYMKDSFTVVVKSGVSPDAEFISTPCELEMRVQSTPTREAWLEARQEAERLNYPGYVVWEVSWAPNETKVIRVSYSMGEMPFFNGLVAGCSLSYVVRTGALWKGPIGKADITIHFKEGDFARSVFLSGKQRVTSFPEQARWVDPGVVTWHFENWEPTEDIWAKSLTWRGIGPKSVDEWDFFFLPHPYEGNKIQYTDMMLEQLVDRELEPWRKFFPEETAKIDRQLYKKLIAEWLYHELYARNGDPFFIGLHVEGRLDPPDAHGYTNHDKNLIGRWRNHFDRYGGMKGWYRPKEVRRGKPPSIKLSSLERKNAEFLKAYFGKSAP